MRVGDEGEIKGRTDDAWQLNVIKKWQIISCPCPGSMADSATTE